MELIPIIEIVEVYRVGKHAAVVRHAVRAQSGYRVVAAPLLRSLTLSSRGYLIETEMLLKAARHVRRFASVPVRVSSECT